MEVDYNDYFYVLEIYRITLLSNHGEYKDDKW